MGDSPSILDVAMAYCHAGLCALPAIRSEKRPSVGRWKQYQSRLPTPAELSTWMADPPHYPDAICILCGVASNNVEIIDFDGGGEFFSAWWDRIPAEFGFRQPIVVDPDGVIIVGHTRGKAAQKLGLMKVPVLPPPGPFWGLVFPPRTMPFFIPPENRG